VLARLPRLLDWLRGTAPHVICLQETKAPDDAFPAADERGLGYEVAAHGDGRGTASRSSPGWATHYAYKLAWLSALRVTVAEELTREHRLAVLGDFNVAPTDGDVWDPAVFAHATHVTPAERAALESLRGAGLVDLVPRPLKHDQPFTYWDYRAGMFHKNMGCASTSSTPRRRGVDGARRVRRS